MRYSALRRAAALLCAASVFLLTGCSRTEKQSRTYYEFFDTQTVITGYDTPRRFEEACRIASDTLGHYHRLADIYHRYSGMENAMTINESAGKGAVFVDEDLIRLLAYGKQICRETGGMCNIAMGAVLSLWHECRETALAGGEAVLPDAALLREAAGHCSIDDLLLAEDSASVILRDPEMSLDLGAIAKGYAAERAAEALTEAGFTGYALSVGGNIRVVGTKPGNGDWIVGIENPDKSSPEAYVLRTALRDAALVTSGSYQRYFETDGIRYHHIISPETLYPKNEYLSVSILCGDSALADALSTAVFNMTPEEGLAFVEGRPEVEACWIYADNSIHFSSGFENRLIQ